MTANWVQVAGRRAQNYISTSEPGFTARWGAAYVVLRLVSTPDGRPIPVDRQNQLFILGGEDWTDETTSGTLHNDVWYSEGIRKFLIESRDRLRRTQATTMLKQCI